MDPVLRRDDNLTGVYDGATKLIERTHTRTDNLNLTNIWDNVTATNNQSFWYSPSNRLQNADGPWGSKTFYYDGVGNRTFENTTISGTTTSDNFTYPATSNRVQSVVRATVTTRSLTYDAAGNILTDSRSGGPYTYSYNKANRLKTVTVGGTVRGTYVYNGFEQLISRVVTNSGTANGTTYFVHDQWGNVIAELNATGATVREYIWLPETEIAPTMQSRTQVDRPIAVVDGVNTASPATLIVHVDHLNRPVRMTNSTKASVWDVIYTPWGTFHSATGAQTLNARFPGQWFQLESGLHYNWHRHYDPSLGRYTQPDPLGFVDGPSVYAYAGNSSIIRIDILGLADSQGPPNIRFPGGGPPKPPGQSFPTTGPPQSRPPQPDFDRGQKVCNKIFEKCIAVVARVCVIPSARALGAGGCFVVRLGCLALLSSGGGDDSPPPSP